MTTVTVDVPANLWVTSNSRLHWRVKARRVRALRRLAHMLVKTRRIPPMGRAHLTVHVHPRRGGRFDPGNTSPAVKALVDGCVDAGLLPDDDPTHLIGPDYRAGEPIPSLPKQWHRLVLTFEEINP